MAQRTKKEKIQLTTELVETLGASGVLYLTDFTGLNVKEITELRRRFREAGHRYIVVKNRLALRALEQLDLPDLTEYLRGPTGFIIGTDDPVAPAKVLRDFAKENEDRPILKVGVVDRRVVLADEVMTLASLPSREELLAGIIGSVIAPLTGIVGVLDGLLRDIASLVEEVAKKQQGNSNQ
jgi:large subunit ribosomal protein L10